MDLSILEKKIKRLVSKLKVKDKIHLEVFDASDIQYGAVLGRGGEGIVRKCTVVYHGIPVDAAVKTIFNNSEDSVEIVLSEIELLCRCKDHIINTTQQVYGVAAVPERNNSDVGHLAFITEVGIKNALQLYQDEFVPLHVTYDLWRHLAAALYFMHTRRRIIHQDLKPENLLITAIQRDIYGQINKLDFRIIDLGMGREMSDDRIVTDDVLGTKGYHAPEVLYGDSFDFRSDTFTLGVTFAVMLLPSSRLHKSSLQSVLNHVHDAKEQHIYGRNLLDILLPRKDCSSISPTILNMISTMLEHVSERKIELLDIQSICQKESDRLARVFAQMTPPPSCQDSGIDSNGDTMSDRTTESTDTLYTPVRRRCTRRVPDVSTGSTSCESSSPKPTPSLGYNLRSATKRSATPDHTPTKRPRRP